jgi:hypothetical protein
MVHVSSDVSEEPYRSAVADMLFLARQKDLENAR